MSSMFEGCKSLLYFPDLSKFEMSKKTKEIQSLNKSHISVILDVSKWDKSKDVNDSQLENIQLIFWSESVLKLDISKETKDYNH